MKQRIWAHRGSSHTEPENTMAAFEQAIRDGADGIEIDVQFSKDKQVVVVHDEFLKRLAGVEALVQDLDYSELEQLNIAKHWQDGRTIHRMPLLTEVLDLLKPTDLMLNIELKNSTYMQPGLEAAVLALVKERQLEDQIIYSSFNHYSMQLIAAEGFGPNCGLLYSEMIVEPWNYAKQVGVGAIHPLFSNLQIPGFVENCAAAGIKIHAWTIDREDHLNMVIPLNIDAIITNEPVLALALRDGKKV